LEFRVTKSAADLEGQARGAVSEGRRVLIAMGGDGTFQILINAVVGAEAVLGIIPAGGGNDLARSLGFPRDPLLALEKIVHGRVQRLDLLLAKTADGRERYYAGGGGIGLDAAAARYANHEYRRLPGRLRYVVAALHALKGFEPLQVKMEFPDGNRAAVQAKVLLASALNTATYGAGLRLAPGAKTDDGLLDMVFMEELSALEIAALLPRLLSRGELRTAGITRMKTSRVRMTCERACSFHADGEDIGPTPVEIAVVPGAIQVLAPAPAEAL
jgi:diacylglycerol kinase (ATP)